MNDQHHENQERRACKGVGEGNAQAKASPIITTAQSGGLHGGHGPHTPRPSPGPAQPAQPAGPVFVAGCKPAGPVCMPDMQTEAQPGHPHQHGQQRAARLAVLFTRRRTTYAGLLPESALWDERRDARTYAGPWPVIAHPPCRGWGRLRYRAKIAPHELDLARFAIAAARRFGGIVEHPAHSRLWDDQGLPRPGAAPDASGGWTLPIDQGWWGHRAPKATWLYIVGLQPHELPRMPFDWPAAGRVTHLGRAERERTPAALAAWLIEAAQMIETH